MDEGHSEEPDTDEDFPPRSRGEHVYHGSQARPIMEGFDGIETQLDHLDRRLDDLRNSLELVLLPEETEGTTTRGSIATQLDPKTTSPVQHQIDRVLEQIRQLDWKVLAIMERVDL